MAPSPQILAATAAGRIIAVDTRDLEQAAVIALAPAGRISAHVQRFTLSDAGAAHDMRQAGQIDDRAFVAPAACPAKGQAYTREREGRRRGDSGNSCRYSSDS